MNTECNIQCDDIKKEGICLRSFSHSSFPIPASASHSPFPILHSPRRGFSLLELLIYIAVLSGLMVVISNAFISLSRGRGQAQARSEVNATARFVAERIRQDIKNASSSTPITAPLLGETSSSTLTIKSPDGLSVITYDALLGQLRRNDAGTYATTTSSNIFVDTPRFTRIENHSTALNATTTSIQIEMTFHYNASSTDWLYADTLRTTVTLR